MRSLKTLIFSLIIIFSSATAFAGLPEVDFQVYTSSYAYNAENTHWEETRTTLTYFENFTEAIFDIKFNNYIDLKLGAALLLPFTYEFPDDVRIFPIVTSRVGNEYINFRIGTLTGGHNLPDIIRDPLMDMTPVVRSTSNTAVYKTGESYKYQDGSNYLTHGYYEYGASFEWFKGGKGEIYMNWQMLHTERHRERFDVGFDYSLDFVSDIFTPYIAIHYWHNGGHEYALPENTPAITENYVGGIGINSKYLTMLYVASYNFLDRDNEDGVFGHGIYVKSVIPIFNWFDVEPVIFVSGWWFNNNHQFISVEGDPFFRVPFYAGINLKKEFRFNNGISLAIGFINGMFFSEDGTVGGRYDQTISLNFIYRIPVTKKKDKVESES